MTTEERLDFTSSATFRRTVVLGTTGTVILAVAGLLGHVSGLHVLGSIRSDYIPMAPSTAISFLIFSAILLRHIQKPWQGFGLKSMTTLVFLTTVFDLLGFVEFFAGIDLNFDEKLFLPNGAIGGIRVGIMSPVSGATFTITGLGILLLLLQGRSSRHAQRLGQWASSLGTLTVLVAATVLLAYLYGVPFMYGGGAVPMAATTALAFLFLGVALVASTV